MGDEDYCYGCGDPRSLCECDEPRCNKDEYVIWARQRIAALEAAGRELVEWSRPAELAGSYLVAEDAFNKFKALLPGRGE